MKRSLATLQRARSGTLLRHKRKNRFGFMASQPIDMLEFEWDDPKMKRDFSSSCYSLGSLSCSDSLTTAASTNSHTPKSPGTTTSTTRSSYSTTSAPSAQGMKDEYGAMDDAGETFVYDGDFVLENGQVLPSAQLRYQTYGTLNAAKDNVIVICHALTGNASLHSWWGGLLGDGLAFDTSQYFVVCCNILGSCYGSTGPMSADPKTGAPYGLDFPDVSVQDTVRLQLTMLQQDLQVESVKCVIGGSFGGMQALEFAVQGGSSQHSRFRTSVGGPFVRSVVPIACGAAHTAWQIAISEVQRQAIYKDPEWVSGRPLEATAGLEVARQMGMVSYRTPQGYSSKFGRNKQPKTTEAGADAPPPPAYGSSARWQVKSYLEYQGQKFLKRFDPVTYVKMTEQMDSHDIGRGRAASTDEVLQTVEIPALVLGIDSDVLYPLEEQEHLARYLPHCGGGAVQVIHSDEGHDGFLLEQDQVSKHITDFLQSIN